MTLIRYNPKGTLSRVSRDFDTFYDSFFKAPVFSAACDCDFTPRVDIVEAADVVNLQMELPGMKKDEIKVLVEDG
ncbi:MAG: hypothetical protein JSV44_02540, partial [Candidatus Zixiibacteriota bacterium]